MNQRDGRVGGRTPEQSTVRPLNDSGGGRALTQEQAEYRRLEAVAGVVAEFYAGHKELDVLKQRYENHAACLALCIELARAIEAEGALRFVRWDDDLDWVEVVELAVAHWVDAKEEPDTADSATAAFELAEERAKVNELKRNDIVESARLGATATLSAAGDKLIEVAGILRTIAEELGPALKVCGCAVQASGYDAQGVCRFCGGRKVAR